MAKVISTVDTKVEAVETIKDDVQLTGKERRLEIKDNPMRDIDQSVTVSTRNLIPNKREVEDKDVQRMVRRVKKVRSEDKEVEKEEKKRGRTKKEKNPTKEE